MKLRKIKRIVKKDKRGQLSSFSVFNWMILGFLAIVMFAGFIWTMGQLKDVFDDVGLQNEKNAGSQMYVNMSKASEDIWGTAYESIKSLRMVGSVYLLAFGASIIIIGFLEKKHPFLFFVYILITLLAIIFAPTISNAYETLLSSGVFEGELKTFTASNFILLHLPAFVLVIGALGGIGLFINLIKPGGEGEIN